MVTVAKVKEGRGAWPVTGVGGTLDVSGKKPGSYYRAPMVSTMAMPGLAGAVAVRSNGTCTVNEYAVYMAVKALQPFFGLTGAQVDGILGRQSGGAIKTHQLEHNLIVDGVIGPQTSKSLFAPMVAEAAALVDGKLPALASVATGHIGFESMWDAGAVGFSTPDDLGLGQINGPSHPAITMDFCLTPSVAIKWIVDFVDANIKAMNGNVRDGIAAYNLGIGGAWDWVLDGRPDVWARTSNGVVRTTAVKAYIEQVLAAA